MKVKVAETAGFCFGVKRAVNKVYELIDTEQKPIFTLGPIIHNEGVVADLEARGVHVIAEADLDSPDDTLQNGTVVIRSHGVGKAIYDKLKEKNISYVDVTCPFVLKIHRIVEKESLAGNHIIIIGDKDHPEVQGICGWCQGPYTVIRNKEEAEAFVPQKGKKISIVSQTTFNYNKFKDLVEILCKKRYDNNVLNILNILNTICNATEERQREAKNIAGEVDTMLVVGGRHSSNTQKLFEICKKECGNTYYIQTPVDLDSEMFQCSSYVGITAGASTPNKIIEEVQEHVRIKF
ncbi:4-hydroxy-3-methylbut-2-enyl diphosphate reductase [Ruminococcus sp. AM44-9AT]|nr:4-hydroxy-3-methylbut-2-enyl diphosphate reductase [Ruminococcus sp. AM44-9AT]